MGKIFRHIILTAAITAVLCQWLAAQERTIISGLDSDSLYMALIRQESWYKCMEDSLNARIAEVRALFRTDAANRAGYSEDIIKLEGEIFDIRNLIGITAGRINSIEQEFIVKNLTQGQANPSAGTTGIGDRYPETSIVLVFNPFFSENLSREDYQTLVRAQLREEGIKETIASFASNYKLIRQIAAGISESEDQATADSLYSRYETLARLNEGYSESVSKDFGFLYDNKLYCYNYILDKLGRRSQLTTYGQKTAETRERAILAAAGSQSPEIAAYPVRKSLLLDYEKNLAQLAGYSGVMDSLSFAASELAAMDFDFPEVVVEEKLFLDYAPVEFHSPAKYDNRNPVPALKVYSRGEIYRILLGSFQRPQPVSILKGAYSVGVLNEGGRFLYYAGGFATLQEASEAAGNLKSKGFRDPKIAVWNNGDYTLMEQSEVDRRLGRLETGLFRLSIDTDGKPLPDIVRELLEDLNSAAEISRNGDLYIIGPFDSRSQAEEVMEDIREETDNIAIKIEQVG